MRIITRKRLVTFGKFYPAAAQPLDDWYRIVKRTTFASAHEVRDLFPSASFLGTYRTVFNIGGNKFRLVVDMRYDLHMVFIRHVVTHAEYDRLTKSGRL